MLTDDVAILYKLDINGVSAFSLRNMLFADRAFTLMLVYRKQSMQIQEFFRMLQYFLVTNSIDIIAGEFSYDLLTMSKKPFRYFHTSCSDGKHSTTYLQL